MISVLLTTCLVAAQWRTDDPSRTFLLGEKQAYMMMPPTFVCGPMVRDVQWSPDGKRLLVHRLNASIDPDDLVKAMSGKPVEPPPVLHELFVYDVATDTSRKVWSVPLKDADVLGARWAPGAPRLLTVVRSKKEEVPSLLAIGLNGQVSLLLKGTPISEIELIASQNGSRTLVQIAAMDPGTRNPRVEFRAVDSSGTLSSPLPFPSTVQNLQWGGDGNELYAYVLAPASRSGAWHRVDLRDFSMTKVERAEPARAPASDLTIAGSEAPLGPGLRAPIVLANPGSGKKEEVGIVTTDGARPRTSSTLSGVAYEVAGALVVRRLVAVPKDMYFAAKAAAERAELLSRAKQIGVALHIFAADWDDNLPANKGWEEKLQPYLKNGSILNGFNYTYAGGPLSAIKEPTKTPLGFFSGPGGRAVLYADGHVKWEQ